MHPIDQLGQPGAIVVAVVITLALISDWTRATLARLAVTEAEAATWRRRQAWLDGVWLDVDRLELEAR